MTCDTNYMCNITTGQTTGICCYTGTSGTTLNPFGPNSRCADKLGPQGQSDCKKRANLCDDELYYNVMTQQCPVTCNRCSLIPTVPIGCADRPSPTGRASECQKRRNLCSDPVYFDVMTRECPKTCNRCGFVTSTTPSYGK
ncbi:unnamed protein product [Auanema sp. JU1783]|nr:unnamed protein product [Auanema sp. JU1783]